MDRLDRVCGQPALLETLAICGPLADPGLRTAVPVGSPSVLPDQVAVLDALDGVLLLVDVRLVGFSEAGEHAFDDRDHFAMRRPLVCLPAASCEDSLVRAERVPESVIVQQVLRHSVLP